MLLKEIDILDYVICSCWEYGARMFGFIRNRFNFDYHYFFCRMELNYKSFNQCLSVEIINLNIAKAI